MAFNTYDNPFDVTMDGNPITGVVSVTVTVTESEVHAAADSDTHESVARGATARVSGTINLVDPSQADSAQAQTGTLIFKWNEVKGGSDKTVTIDNASTGGWTSSVTRDAASSGSVPFIAESQPVIT